uniref:RT_RNaseH domain-containing protein n=1 Tax=Haemonchus contortus TaxID=6289 RepID=A0A7I5E915_HAECO
MRAARSFVRRHFPSYDENQRNRRQEDQHLFFLEAEVYGKNIGGVGFLVHYWIEHLVNSTEIFDRDYTFSTDASTSAPPSALLAVMCQRLHQPVKRRMLFVKNWKRLERTSVPTTSTLWETSAQ